MCIYVYIYTHTQFWTRVEHQASSGIFDSRTKVYVFNVIVFLYLSTNTREYLSKQDAMFAFTHDFTNSKQNHLFHICIDSVLYTATYSIRMGWVKEHMNECMHI